MFLYPPGKQVSRGFSVGSYNPVQEAKYRIVEDTVYSEVYGFARTRLPTPGAMLPEIVVVNRLAQMEAGIAAEKHRDRHFVPGGMGSRGLPVAEIGTLHQQHIAERLRPYPQMKPARPAQEE